jgi:hypothetical protein
MLHAASLQRLGRYTGQCIHGPNCSSPHWANDVLVLAIEDGIAMPQTAEVYRLMDRDLIRHVLRTGFSVCRRRLLITGVFLMVLGMIARVATSDDAPDVSGTRTGSWNMPNSGGTVTLTVKQDGSLVTGDITFKVDLKGARNYSASAISGTVSKRNGRYVLSFSGGRVQADLNVSDGDQGAILLAGLRDDVLRTIAMDWRPITDRARRKRVTTR